jgi:hypothetical protein
VIITETNNTSSLFDFKNHLKVLITFFLVLNHQMIGTHPNVDSVSLPLPSLFSHLFFMSALLWNMKSLGGLKLF